MAYTSTGREDELNARVRELQTKIENLKQESSKQMDKLRNETANMLDKLGKAVRREEKGAEKTQQ